MSDLLIGTPSVLGFWNNMSKSERLVVSGKRWRALQLAFSLSACVETGDIPDLWCIRCSKYKKCFGYTSAPAPGNKWNRNYILIPTITNGKPDERFWIKCFLPELIESDE
jgi:hypothetical protein